MKTELKNLAELSIYAGQRFDFVQAGGGNTSVKISAERMFVKASGFNLAQVSEPCGFCEIDTKTLLSSFNKNKTALKNNPALFEKIIKDANKTTSALPSMETILHALLPHKYILHTHPLAVNAAVCQKDWRKALSKLFKDAVFIDYKNPGGELAAAIEESAGKAQIIFLQNHGLITAGKNPQEVISLTENVTKAIEKELGLNFAPYKLTSELAAIINKFSKQPLVALLSCDSLLETETAKKVLFSPPLFPDQLVYCGPAVLKLTTPKQIQEYKKKYKVLPKVIFYKKHLFFIAKDLKKAKEMLEVFKAHTIAAQGGSHNNPLAKKDIDFILNCEAEKYRQNL